MPLGPSDAVFFPDPAFGEEADNVIRVVVVITNFAIPGFKLSDGLDGF